MFAHTGRRADTLEFSILHNTKAIGPAIGRLDGLEFFEFVTDEFGRLFSYSGVAPRLSNGRLDDTALRAGEFIVLPGLIYEYCEQAKKRRRAA
jgi:hypothetical protein